MSAKRTVTCFRSPSKDCREAKNLFSEVPGNICVWRWYSGDRKWCGCCRVIDQLPAVPAKLGSLPIGFAALRTSCLKTSPTVVAKDRGE